MLKIKYVIMGQIWFQKWKESEKNNKKKENVRNRNAVNQWMTQVTRNENRNWLKTKTKRKMWKENEKAEIYIHHSISIFIKTWHDYIREGISKESIDLSIGK